MCQCINIEIGSYDNQVELSPPRWSSKDKICVDRCLSDEIQRLWGFGVQTTGCCCGHNKNDGFIGVVDSDIWKMKSLGYKVHFNPMRPKDEDSFTPLMYNQWDRINRK